jgi:PPOX class probable F420-dependent enzyme
LQIPSPHIDRALDRWAVARLATLAAPGAPHLVPVVFARAEGRLWIPVDGKPKRGGELARVRNVRAHPAVSLLLDHYDPDWSRLWWIRLDGTARVLAPADPATDGAVRAAVAALRAKYPQYDGTPLLRDPPTLIAIRPERTRSWRASEAALPESAD